MAGEDPFLAREESIQVGLDLDRVGVARPAEPAGQAADVRVDDDAVGRAEGVSEDDVRGLPADPGKRVKRFHRPRDEPAVRLDDRPAGAPDRFRLGVEEAGGSDQLLQLASRPGHRGGGREAAEERRRDAVHARVGALRGEDRRDQELERVGMVERAVGPGVGLVQAGEDVGGGRGTRLRAGGHGGRRIPPRGARGRLDSGPARWKTAPRVTPPRFPAFLLCLVLAAPAAAADRVVLTVLQTSDLHANLLPWDYARGAEGAWGLARVATRIRQIRKESPNVLLLDGGDTIQGAPTGWLEARRPSGGPHFIAVAMNALGYDAMSVGNHEFNFGMDVLRRAQKDSSFPWLSANTRNVVGRQRRLSGSPREGARRRPRRRPGPDDAEHPGLGARREPARPDVGGPGRDGEAPRSPPPRRRSGCDVVVVLFHSGLEADPETGEPNGTGHENRVVALARERAGHRPDPDGSHAPEALDDPRPRRAGDATGTLGRGARARRPRRRAREGQGDRRRGDRRPPPFRRLRRDRPRDRRDREGPARAGARLPERAARDRVRAVSGRARPSRGHGAPRPDQRDPARRDRRGPLPDLPPPVPLRRVGGGAGHGEAGLRPLPVREPARRRRGRRGPAEIASWSRRPATTGRPSGGTVASSSRPWPG